MTLDTSLLHFFQEQLSNPVLDFLCIWGRKSWVWAPLYVGILIFWIRNKNQSFWPLFIGALVLFALTDYTSASIIKPWVGRLRPCQESGLVLNPLVTCGSGFSFPSSHATNHFALAYFFFHFVKKSSLWFFWAGMIAFSQMYVGVHYFTDVLAGAVWGTFLSWLVVRVMFFLSKRYSWNISF
jgi:membrane-associated phospholipid phosphatase